MDFELYCDYEYKSITLVNKSGNINTSFSDELAVYLTYNVLLSLSNNNKKGIVK